ncbi:hypothetical protein SAMN05421687_101597 [Salimicrobium flavidum]|uniref:Uncharacterized protein n=1 Tax=Salimicrobium flavidum TaxID=570947 RepID=A0A1N7IMW6_9BACI|nr:hypothetical protein SAMN05421687_101597 [Salimicrobium flavidum]
MEMYQNYSNTCHRCGMDHNSHKEAVECCNDADGN